MMPNGRNIARIFPKSRIDGEHRHKLAALMRSLFSEKSPGSKTGACAFAKDTEFDRYFFFFFFLHSSVGGKIAKAWPISGFVSS